MADRRDIFGLEHPFFAPLWRRVAVVLVCIGWAMFEFVEGSPFWGMLFGGLGIYCGWKLFFAFDPEAVAKKEEPDRE
jgi:hypothetical protein